MQKHLTLLFVTAALFILGCAEENTEPLPDGHRYFPLEMGMTLIYRTDSIIFDDDISGNVMDTLSGFVRETVVDTMTTGDGILAHIVSRTFRKTEGDPWSAPVLVLIHKDDQNAFRKEGNLRFVKMRFPLRETTEWAPTSFFNEFVEVQIGTENIEMYTSWDGRVLSMDKPETIGALSFDSVMTCIQADDDNEIERRFVTEKYATGIGLIYRADTILDSRCKRLGDLEPCFDETWSQRGEKGYILHQELIAIE